MTQIQIICKSYNFSVERGNSEKYFYCNRNAIRYHIVISFIVINYVFNKGFPRYLLNFWNILNIFVNLESNLHTSFRIDFDQIFHYIRKIIPSGVRNI